MFSISFFLVVLLLSVVFVEGLTELVRKASILDRPRGLVTKIPFFDALLSCGYCTSVWAAALPASLVFLVGAGLLLYEQLLLFVFFTVVLHRLANYLHNFNDKHLDKYYEVPRQQWQHHLMEKYKEKRGQEN